MARFVRETYPKLTRWRLRHVSRLRRVLKGRPPIVFIHVPKTAGSAIRAYLRACLGSNSSGRSVGINDVPFQESPITERLDAARSAQFVHGHISWDSVSRLDRPDAFTFTFLRSPKGRLRSLYTYLLRRETWRERIEKAGLKSAADIAAWRDPMVLARADNYMVRQFAGSVRDYPVAPEDWPRLLDRAISNLNSLSFIGYQESFDNDFALVLERLNLPRMGNFAIVNPTAKNVDTDFCIDDSLYYWDQQLYDAVTLPEITEKARCARLRLDA
jgi:hypothetical protein